MFWHTSRERRGIRAWWHFGSDGPRSRCIGVEFYWWRMACHATVSTDDEGWNMSLAFPPFSFYLSLEGFPLWRPMRKHLFTWETPAREVWLPEQRECSVAIHDWTIWLKPWGKSMEWVKADPWWVRGVSFNVERFLRGKARYACENTGEPFTVMVDMPEGHYEAVFTPQRQTWRYPRWFTHTRDSFDVKIPKGIPFAGKGENSWDCGDDGLFGCSEEGSIDEAKAKIRDYVMGRRRRYGNPSDQAVREALAAGTGS